MDKPLTPTHHYARDLHSKTYQPMPEHETFEQNNPCRSPVYGTANNQIQPQRLRKQFKSDWAERGYTQTDSAREYQKAEQSESGETITELRKQLADAQEQLSIRLQLQSHNQQVLEQYSKVNQQLIENQQYYQLQIKRLTQDVQAHKEQQLHPVATLHNQLAQQVAARQELQKKLSLLQAQLQSSTAQLHSTRAQLRSKISEVQAKMAELQASRAQLLSSRAQLQSIRAQLQSIRAQLHSKTAELQQLTLQQSQLIETTSERDINREGKITKLRNTREQNKSIPSHEELFGQNHAARQQLKTQQLKTRPSLKFIQKLPKHLYTYYLQAAEKLPSQTTTPLDLQITDRLFQGRLLAQQILHKYTISTAIQKLQKKHISRTKLIYKYDPDNTTSFHRYIDGIRRMLIVVKTSKGIYLAGYYSGQYRERTPLGAPGLLISLLTGESFELFRCSDNRKYLCRAMTYDKFYFTFGNSQIRMNWNYKRRELFSNFGASNSFFNSREFTVDAMLGEGDNRSTTFETFEIYQIEYDDWLNGADVCNSGTRSSQFR